MSTLLEALNPFKRKKKPEENKIIESLEKSNKEFIEAVSSPLKFSTFKTVTVAFVSFIISAAFTIYVYSAIASQLPNYWIIVMPFCIVLFFVLWIGLHRAISRRIWK